MGETVLVIHILVRMISSLLIELIPTGGVILLCHSLVSEAVNGTTQGRKVHIKYKGK
jgi:hypothetical protein